jgi:hypothetical protein
MNKLTFFENNDKWDFHRKSFNIFLLDILKLFSILKIISALNINSL